MIVKKKASPPPPFFVKTGVFKPPRVGLAAEAKAGYFLMYSAISEHTAGGHQEPHTRKRSIPAQEELGTIFNSEHDALKFLEKAGVIDPPKNCPSCGGGLHPMSKDLSNKSRFVIRCRARKCADPYRASIFCFHDTIPMQIPQEQICRVLLSMGSWNSCRQNRRHDGLPHLDCH